MSTSPEELRFELPYPPSVNKMWFSDPKRVGVRHLTAGGKAYRKLCGQRILLQKVPRWENGIRGRLAVSIAVYPPKAKRRRDLDNLLKAPLDALQHCGVIEDDEHIDRLELLRYGELLAQLHPDGVLSITIWRVG